MRTFSPSILLQRSLIFFYLGILIVLPIIAITAKSMEGGFQELWSHLVTPHALAALKLTFGTAIIMVIINVIMGIITAFVLVRYEFPFKKIINSLIDLPFAIPTVVTGIMLVALYGPQSVLGAILHDNGIEIIYDKPGIIFALLFVTFPFVVRSIQPVLMEMDQDIEDAAKILGASNIATFFKITLPILWPSILTGAALSFSRAIGEFGSIVVVAGNIPMKTQVAAVYIYGELESNNPQGALGLSVLLLMFSFLILIFLNYLKKLSGKEHIV